MCWQSLRLATEKHEIEKAVIYEALVLRNIRVSDAMTRNVQAVGPRASLAITQDLMENASFHPFRWAASKWLMMASSIVAFKRLRCWMVV